MMLTTPSKFAHFHRALRFVGSKTSCRPFSCRHKLIRISLSNGSLGIRTFCSQPSVNLCDDVGPSTSAAEQIGVEDSEGDLLLVDPKSMSSYEDVLQMETADASSTCSSSAALIDLTRCRFQDVLQTMFGLESSEDAGARIMSGVIYDMNLCRNRLVSKRAKRDLLDAAPSVPYRNLMTYFQTVRRNSTASPRGLKQKGRKIYPQVANLVIRSQIARLQCLLAFCAHATPKTEARFESAIESELNRVFEIANEMLEGSLIFSSYNTAGLLAILWAEMTAQLPPGRYDQGELPQLIRNCRRMAFELAETALFGPSGDRRMAANPKYTHWADKILRKSFYSMRERQMILDCFGELQHRPPSFDRRRYSQPMLADLDQVSEQLRPGFAIFSQEELTKLVSDQLRLESSELFYLSSASILRNSAQDEDEDGWSGEDFNTNYNRFRQWCMRPLIANWKLLEEGKLAAGIEEAPADAAGVTKAMSQLVGLVTAEEMAALLFDALLPLFSRVRPDQYEPFHHQFHAGLGRRVERIARLKYLHLCGYNVDQEVAEVVMQYVNYFDRDRVDALNCDMTPREYWQREPRSLHVPVPRWSADFGRQIGEALTNFLTKSLTFTSGDRVYKVLLSLNSSQGDQRSKGVANPMTVVTKIAVDKRFLRRIKQIPFSQEVGFDPMRDLPMLAPPVPWYSATMAAGGGAHYTMSPDLVRNKFGFETHAPTELLRRVLHREHPQPLGSVFDSLNQTGSVPWRVNNTLLDIAKQVFNCATYEHDKPEVVELARKLDIPLPAETVDVDAEVPEPQVDALCDAWIEKRIDHRLKMEGFNRTYEEMDAAQRQTYKELVISEYKKHRIYRERHRLLQHQYDLKGLHMTALYVLLVAEYCRDRPIWFPHNVDFRGRCYPLAAQFNHMQGDLSRSLLHFYKKKPLGENGLDWLKLHIVNLTGELKKASMDARLRRANELMPLIRDSAQHPLDGKMWWVDSDEPWQTLSACIEIVNAVDSGDPCSYECGLPVHQDGSCNGLQHYAALGRDDIGGYQVNLVPADMPQDVYSQILKNVLRQVRANVDNENSKELTDHERQVLRMMLDGGHIVRKTIKQTIMTVVYGVTLYGGRLQILKQLEDQRLNEVLGLSYMDMDFAARHLSHQVFTALNESYKRSRNIQAWLTEVARVCAKLCGKTVEWRTPLGFPAIQPYMKEVVFSSPVDGTESTSLAPMVTKQAQAFPPNFIHSLDSSHMMLTSLHCQHHGITYAAVHDCYWTHACDVEKMNRLLREQFVNLHSQDIIGDLQDFLYSHYLKPALQKGNLDRSQELYLEQLFTKKFTLGSLDLDDVKNSTYFFG